MKDTEKVLKVIRIPEETHKKLKAFAGISGLSMEEVANEAIKKYCKQ